MRILRTPDERFRNLPDYPFEPHYTEVEGLRIHHAEQGPDSADPVLMLHGEPSWSFLYRHMIPVIADAGHRAVAPDLIGFGRSDKIAGQASYSYKQHVEWMKAWIRAMELERITLVCQDWGSLIGLRLVGEMPERFARVVVANGFLPTGDEGRIPKAFKLWRAFARYSPLFPIGRIVASGCASELSKEVIAGYDAPFPRRAYKAAARAFPALVPTTPADPANADNRRAWQTLERFDKPFLTAFGTRDPITRGADRVLQQRIPGAKGQPHTSIRGAGHFIQEDKGPELARVVVEFIDRPAP